MNHDYLNIEALVNDLIRDNRALNQCVQDEQRYHSANEYLALAQSNISKARINANLRQTLARLDSYLANVISYGDLLVKLSFYAGTLDSRNQSNLLNLIQQLREEYKIGVQLMQFNRRLVNSNKSDLREFA